jgi:hypothetical protein
MNHENKPINKNEKGDMAAERTFVAIGDLEANRGEA